MAGKKMAAAALFAGVLGFGMMGGNASAQASCLDGHAGYGMGMACYESTELAASNEFSRRMQEEDLTHEQIVRSLRYEYRRDGDRAKYDRDLREEQKRHDKAVQKIKDDYNHYARKHRQ